MTRYLRSLIAIGFGSLVYIILSFGARFDRTDELTSDAEPKGSVGQRVEGKQSNHIGRNITFRERNNG